jgi:hypothetical protein
MPNPSRLHRAAARLAVSALAVAGLAVGGCSSDSGDETKGPLGASGGNSGSAAGGASSGGAPSGAGGQAEACSADTGDSLCRECLAGHCCAALEACLADATCSAALDEHEACFGTPGADPSECFGAFSRSLSGASADALGVIECIILECTGLVCGAPQVV